MILILLKFYFGLELSSMLTSIYDFIINIHIQSLYFWIFYFFCIFITFRSTLPRFKIENLLDLYWKYIILYSFFVLIMYVIILFKI